MALWPSYLAFALSFFVILVTWISHHDLMRPWVALALSVTVRLYWLRLRYHTAPSAIRQAAPLSQ